MKYIIELPEEVKEKFDNATKDDIYGNYYDYNSVIGNAIKNSIPFSKGHGSLIDGDALRKEILSWGMNDYEPSDFIDEIDMADVIIEADKGE